MAYCENYFLWQLIAQLPGSSLIVHFNFQWTQRTVTFAPSFLTRVLPRIKVL